MTMEEMQARIEIRELVDTFQNLETNGAEQAKLFTDDGKLIVYYGEEKSFDLGSAEEIKNAFLQVTGAIKRSHHMNGQQVLKFVDENNAEGTLYCRMALVTEEDGKEILTDHYVYYNDTYQKVNGKWFIKSRISHFVISDKHVLNS